MEMRQVSYTAIMQAGVCITADIVKMQLSFVQVISPSVHLRSIQHILFNANSNSS